MKNSRKIILVKILFLVIMFLIGIRKIYSQGLKPTVPVPERVRTYDIEHIIIDVSFDRLQKKVTGKVITRIRPLSDGFRDFRVDAVGFNIHSIRDEDDNDLGYDYDGNIITIKPGRRYSRSDEIVYTVSYDCVPQRGLYFIYPTELNPSLPYQIWTQGEDNDNRYWIPVYDYPNDKTTFEVYVTVENKYKTLSNGYFKDSKVINNSNERRDHWVMDKPVSTYLIMLAAGDFNVVHDKQGNVPVLSYTDRNVDIEDAKFTFRNTPEMVRLFNDKYSYNYPWSKYAQIVVEDFIYGGMENVSATVLNRRLIYNSEVEKNYSAEGTISHELGHQWWGDLTTCRNWSEMWLNEGFATYSDLLWKEKSGGTDEYDYEILSNGDNALRTDSVTGRYPIWAGYGSVTVNLYDKASVILNTFRYILGDEIFFASLGTFLKDNEYKNVVTQDLVNAVNKAYLNSGKPAEDFKWMFEQWIQKAGYPKFDVNYDYDDDRKELALKVRQVQTPDSLTPVFRTAADIRIKNSAEDIIRRIEITGNDELFNIPLNDKPEMVIFNYGNNILCRTYFRKPIEDWKNQYRQSEDAIDRIMALRGLEMFLREDEAEGAGETEKQSALSIFETVLTADKFWGVRVEAAKILGRNFDLNGTSEVLRNAYENQSQPRVKREILKALGFSRKREDADFIRSKIENERDDYIVAYGISSLAKSLPGEDLYDAAIPFAKRTSHRNVVQSAVIEALDSADNAGQDERIKKVLLDIAFGIDVEGRLRAEAIAALKTYAKDEDVKSLAIKYIDYNFIFVKRGLISLLGNSGDKSLIPLLKDMNMKTTDEGLSRSIMSAINKLEESN